MERQRKKALALKPRWEANTEATKNQTAEGSEINQALETVPPPSTEQAIELVRSEYAKDEPGELVSYKHPRGTTWDKAEAYVPSWNIKATHSIISRAPDAARHLGGILCRSMTPLKEKQIMSLVDPLEAFINLMASLSMVGTLLFLFRKFSLLGQFF